jgi:Fe-S oxidoreductase
LFLFFSVRPPFFLFDRVGERLLNMVKYAFGQKRVLARRFGANHFIFFWACILLVVVNVEFMLGGIFPTIRLANLPDGLYFPVRLISDIMSLLTLGAVVLALIRRTFFPLYPEARNFVRYFIVVTIAIHMLAYFGISAAEIILGRERAMAYMPVSVFSTRFFSGIGEPGVEWLHGLFWWIHAGALLLLFTYLIPYTKHLHVITAIGNCFFRSFEKPNTQPRETFQIGGDLGADEVDKLTWKDLFDSFACTECGRCEIVCPAQYTGKKLNPRQVIHDIKVNLVATGSALQQGKTPELALIGEGGEGSCTEEAIWDCTTCGACLEACPVFIEHPQKVVKMRRHLVQMKSRFPDELLNLFDNMEQRSNPWGIAPTERTKWSSLMEIKDFNAEETEYLFYVGCAGSFDTRNKHVTVALATILDAAGVSWGTLGKDELCCGDSVRRLGNEYVFEQMALKNVELLKARGVKKIITQCPHCFSTFKNDYRQYGLEIEVFHHSQLIDELLKSGRLKLPKTADAGRTLFHDSCYLGRHNETYQPPRDVIAAATGIAPAEFERCRENSFCCGAGGGRMWMEENSGTRINRERVKESLLQTPDTICVSCPYCMTMIIDGLKDAKADTVKVMDIAEVVAESMRLDQ